MATSPESMAPTERVDAGDRHLDDDRLSLLEGRLRRGDEPAVKNRLEVVFWSSERRMPTSAGTSGL